MKRSIIPVLSGKQRTSHFSVELCINVPAKTNWNGRLMR